MIRDILNEVLQNVYVNNRVHCALKLLIYILLTLLFLYGVLRAQVRCKRLTSTLLHVTFQKYKGLVKANHEVNHYNLTPVPGSNGRLFFSKFADQDVIVMVGAPFDDPCG